MGFKMKPKSPLTMKLTGKSPAKLEKKPTGPRAEKKTDLSPKSPPGKGTIGQEYLKGGQKGLTGRAAYRYGTSINPSQKEVTRLQKEYEKSNKKSPAKLDVVVNKSTPKERKPKPTPTGPKRRPQPVMPKKRQHATGAKGLPSSEYLKKREGAGPRSELYNLNRIPYGTSPAKLKKGKGVMIDGKEYPKGYTKKDVAFLKKQKEDVVRYEDLDAKGKAIYDAKRKNKKPLKAKKKTNTVGTGFMNPPYKDTVKGSRPYAKRQGYHGYKNFKSILKK